MGSDSYHEPVEELTEQTRDLHRAITSLMEELEAVDWYQQRIDASRDEELREILAHNRDEEKEHAAMVIEWLRRRDPKFAEELGEYLYAEGSITAQEESIDGGAPPGDGSLDIGSLKGEEG